jgi:WavE lipopolysaccharide synthesis
MHSTDLSLVVQGPVRRVARGNDAPSTDDVLRTLRCSVPYAEIVLSTWQGSDVAGLIYDTLVLSADPGAFRHPFGWSINVNRMIVSTAAGLAAAHGTYAVKTRTDVLIDSDLLLAGELAAPETTVPLARRVRVGSIATRNAMTTFMPFHVGDIVQFGTTSDLRQWWAADTVAATDYFLPPGEYNEFRRPERMNAEQMVFTRFLQRHDWDAAPEHICDTRFHLVSESLDALLGTIDVFDETSCGVHVPRHIERAVPAWQRHTGSDFTELRAAWRVDAAITAQRFHDILQQNRARVLARLAAAPDGPRFI